MISVSLVEHAIKRYALNSAPASASTWVTTYGLVVIFSRIICHVLTFWLQRSENFLPIFRWLIPIRVDTVNLSVRCVKTWCTFFALAVLEWPWTFILACGFSLLAQLSEVQYLRSAEFLELFIQLFQCSWVPLTRWLWSWPASNALIACVIACSSETSEACALRQRNLRKKSNNVSLSYCWQEKKSSSVLTSAWKP
jgi:hypothetical protein